MKDFYMVSGLGGGQLQKKKPARPTQRRAARKGTTKGDKLLHQSAIFCGFLRFAAVSCENLVPPKLPESRGERSLFHGAWNLSRIFMRFLAATFPEN